MRNYFIFNGVDSRDYGVYISGTGRLTIPEKAYNFQNIPGRNGDLIVAADARLQNDVITYPAFIPPYNDSGVPRSYSTMVGRLRSWLMSVKGYAELRDSYDEKYYRLAAFAGPMSFETFQTLEVGSFELEFNCKPQRYLDDGGETYQLSAGESMTVDKCGFYYSEPLFIVEAPSGFATSSFTVGDKTVVIADNALTYPLYIDSRLMACYDANGVNANRWISFSDYEFPTVSDGIVITTNDIDLTIEPRWFEL